MSDRELLELQERVKQLEAALRIIAVAASGSTLPALRMIAKRALNGAK